MSRTQKQTRLLMTPIPVLCLLALAACGNGAAGANGKDGTNGTPGANGTACTAKSNGDGTTTITCTDGTSATVKDGASGADGTNGTNGTNGANGANGADGISCSMVNNADGTRTITCGTATVTISGAVNDYSLLSAAEKADATPSAVITAVSIPADGRPVVTIKVSDRKGNGLRKLAPVSPTTWRFALLKLVPASGSALGVNGSASDTWVSYNAANATSTASAENAGVNAASTTTGLLTDNADGTYTYRFAKVITNAAAAGTTYDATATHRLVVLIYDSVNAFQPINLVEEFVPSTGVVSWANWTGASTGPNDKVDPAACLQCHTRFRAPAGGTGAFHGGSRYDIRTCAACHNDQRRFTAIPGTGSTPAADDSAIQPDGTWAGNMTILNGEAVINLPVFIHKIHMGKDLSMTKGTYTAKQFPDITYPQDARNCTKCHRAPAPMAANWMKPSRRACGACHDNVSFATTLPPGRVGHAYPKGGNLPLADDSQCATCHGDGSSGTMAPIPFWHTAVAPPDANSTWAGGTNSNTNAAYLASANAIPAGAIKITSVVKSVSRDGNKNPVIVFKLQSAPAASLTTLTDVVFPSPTPTGELIANFVGSPTLYFAWSILQDGIAAPADFNISASGYLKRIWNGSATGSAAGTLAGPDSNGFYSVTLTGVTVADNATMLTGGVGYAYSLGTSKASTSTNQPLTQVNLTDYPVAANGTGGLIVPTPDVWLTATGYTARRAIVDNAKCNGCHEALGAAPTFHAGQRNDGPTCAFCHKPNQTSSGWSASSSSFIHGIHGNAKRDVPFTWHAVSATQTYAEVTYPGVLNNCEMCHKPGTYDFSSTATLSAYPNMLFSTVGTGRYNSSLTTNPTGYFSISPFVASDNQTDYGFGFATSNVSATLPNGISGTQGSTNCTPAAPCTCTTGNPCSVTISDTYTVNNVPVTFSQKTPAIAACSSGTPCTCTTAQPCTGVVATCSTATPCDAQGTTLVTSPMVAACTGCHTSPMMIDHMQANGGSFYEPRATALKKPQQEQCLLCHGAGTVASIYDMHMTR